MPAPTAASAVALEGAADTNDKAVEEETTASKKVNDTEGPCEATVVGSTIEEEEKPAVEEKPAAVEAAKESASDAKEKASGSDSGDADRQKTADDEAPEELAQEPPATRVARLWMEYAEKSEKLKDADRLTQSSEYRQWIKTAELELPEGVAIPPFTEVWLAANRKPVAESRRGRQRGSKKKGGAEDEPPVTSVNAITTKRLKNGEKASSKTDSGCDPLADFAAEAKQSYDSDNPPTREGGEEDGKQWNWEHRASRWRGAAELTHAQCIEMFDTALRSLCEDGLARELPINACVISDRMRRRFREYHIQSTPFGRFGELVKAAADEGLIKVRPQGSQSWIEWIKYKYKVVPRDHEERGTRERRRRSRSRRKPGARTAGDARARGGRERERRDRVEHARGRSDRKDSGRTRGGARDGRGARGRQTNFSPDYEYSYEYTDEEYSYSPSPERRPKQARHRQ